MISEAVLKEPSSAAVVSMLRPDYTFERFVRGEGNMLACSASMAVSENPARTYNPLFIHSASGLGKTHLLHAIGNYATHQHCRAKIVYVTCERFATEFYRSIHEGKTTQFRRIYRSVDILLLDDVHFLREKAATQEELFHTFNDLYHHGKQIVLTSDRPPEELPQLQEGLVSRFRWGLVADIQPPSFAARVGILHAKAQEHRLEIPEAVLELIARRVHSNIRALEGALVRLMAVASLNGREITTDIVSDLLPVDTMKPCVLEIEMIKSEIARHYQVALEKLEGDSRERRVVQARQIAIYLARELTANSFPALGLAFGDRDHSTIMHAYRKAKTFAESPLFRSEIDQLKEQLLRLASTSKPQ